LAKTILSHLNYCCWAYFCGEWPW